MPRVRPPAVASVCTAASSPVAAEAHPSAEHPPASTRRRSTRRDAGRKSRAQDHEGPYDGAMVDKPQWLIREDAGTSVLVALALRQLLGIRAPDDLPA